MKKKILVVDDEKDFLDLIQKRLEFHEYAVTPCTRAAGALLKFRQQRFDAVLLDILMPEMDGLELLTQMRKENPLVPVFMITAFSNDERFREAKRLGAAGFIVKTQNMEAEVKNITAILRLADQYKGHGVS